MKTEELMNGLERCFISPNVCDKNWEPANVVDVLDHAAINLNKIAQAITPSDAAALPIPGGGCVGSLTEAVVYSAQNLGKIAEAINYLADAIRDSANTINDTLYTPP